MKEGYSYGYTREQDAEYFFINRVISSLRNEEVYAHLLSLGISVRNSAVEWFLAVEPRMARDVLFMRWSLNYGLTADMRMRDESAEAL